MRPTVTPAELVARCEALLAWLAPRVEREIQQAGRRAKNDNRPAREPMWWERD